MLVRASAAFLVVIACFLTTQEIESRQLAAPFGSDIQFSLNVSNSGQRKEDLALGLAQIADDLNIILGKVSPDKEDYRGVRDIILFGRRLPASDGPAVTGNDIWWLDPSMRGTLLGVDDLEDRTLNGAYFTSYVPKLFDRLEAWSRENGVRLSVAEAPTSRPLADITALLMLSGGGLVLLSASLMTFAAVMCYAQQRYRAMKIQLVGRGSVRAVAFENAAGALILLVQGGTVGLLIFAVALLVRPAGILQVQVVLREGNPWGAVVVLVVFLLSTMLAALALPSLSDIAARSVSTRFLKTASRVLSCLGIAAAIVAAAGAASSLSIQRDALGQLSAYQQMPQATRLSFISMPEGGDASLEGVRRLAAVGVRNQSLELSLDVGQSMSVSDEDLEGYDGFFILNRSYVSSLDVGIEEPGQRGRLVALSDDEVPTAAREFAGVWLDSERPATLRFYRFEGPELMAMGPNPGMGGVIAIRSNPLVLLIDDVSVGWNTDGFIYPLMSTGNIFFNHYDAACEAIASSEINDQVASVDNLFELTRDSLQRISALIASYVWAVLVALGAAAAIGIMDAMAWASSKKRAIFAKRTSGARLVGIAFEGVLGEMLVIALAGLMGAILALLVAGRSGLMTLTATLGLCACCAAAHVGARCLLAARSCANTAERR